MTQAIAITQFPCPGCRAALELPTDGPTTCPLCRWHGQAYLFSPLAIKGDAAELALPDDATCIHHPRKKAVAICAGSGDYICSLCAIDLNGQTYSAEYLNTGGKETIGKAFDRYLPRPDSQIMLYFLCLFIPYINVIFIPFAFIWIPHAFYLYFKALRLQRENDLFRRVMGNGRIIGIPVLLSLAALGWIYGVFAIIYYALLD